jgi:hypothetical protein
MAAALHTLANIVSIAVIATPVVGYGAEAIGLATARALADKKELPAKIARVAASIFAGLGAILGSAGLFTLASFAIAVIFPPIGFTVASILGGLVAAATLPAHIAAFKWAKII